MSGRAWLLQIVRNAAYSTLKARRRGMEVSLSSGTRAADEDGVDMDMPDPSPGPEATLAQRQDLVALDDALNALPVLARMCHLARSRGAILQGDGADHGRSDRNGHVAPRARGRRSGEKCSLMITRRSSRRAYIHARHAFAKMPRSAPRVRLRSAPRGGGKKRAGRAGPVLSNAV